MVRRSASVVAATRLAQRCLFDPRHRPTITDRAPKKGLTNHPGKGTNTNGVSPPRATLQT